MSGASSSSSSAGRRRHGRSRHARRGEGRDGVFRGAGPLAFRQGLSETGFLVGKNLRIEYRWAEGQYDRLPALAADLVASSAELIVTTGGPQPFRAVRRLTNTIPVVFASGSDPVGDGLVDRLDRPGGNVTGRPCFCDVAWPETSGTSARVGSQGPNNRLSRELDQPSC